MDAPMQTAAALTNAIARDWKEDQEAQAFQDGQPLQEIMEILVLQGHKVLKEKRANGVNTEMQAKGDLE